MDIVVAEKKEPMMKQQEERNRKAQNQNRNQNQKKGPEGAVMSVVNSSRR